uniref:transport membrane protein n=1 Tax=Scutellaria franchetiana TaxID=2023964 RepID=UPI00211462CB|nr:transport membrane protein [Scutellaria franchetiana]USM11302.1 transport membrane protein [Scutellaria franchetiana]
MAGRSSIFPLNFSYISYEFHFAPETLLGEVRIRSVRILIGLGLTWFTRYWFPEELISPLAKPFITLPFDSYFVRTQSTEAFPTYVATSSIACSYFVFPLISHQIWCFLIPSCYGEQRRKYNRFLHLSGSRFSLLLFLTLPRVVPNVWHFPYFMGETSTNSLMIKLQPKIYDHIMLTVRISFIPSVCSQVPVIVIRLLEPRGLSVETSTNNRRFLMVLELLTAALSTPPDIWCQIVARFLISFIIELAIFVASIVQVREEGWTSGMRESGSIDKKKEKKSSPLEPGKVIINEFQSNSQPTYAIHSRKDYNTQKTPYLRIGMSDTSGARR